MNKKNIVGKSQKMILVGKPQKVVVGKSQKLLVDRKAYMNKK